MNRRKFWAGIMIGLALAIMNSAPSFAYEASEIIHPASPAPKINAPRVTGTTPGRPFLFLIPATGEKPLAFSAKNLPANLSLDSKTGIIMGVVEKEGTYVVELTVKGPKGVATRNLTIIAGTHKLAQTPPMGWNSWNVWGLP